MRNATGEMEETPDGRNAAAVALGRRGGLARAKKLSKARKIQIARAGGKAKAGKARKRR